MGPTPEPRTGIAFGRFQVSPDRREVLADGKPVKLGGRAFDILLALIEARGTTVSKDTLMARVWPGQITEENSLQVQISALRAAFGAERGLIRTVAGRGYQFTGYIRGVPVSPAERAGAAAAQPAAVRPPTNIPEPISELIGRDVEVAAVLNLIGRHRFVTFTGAGGIGEDPARPRGGAPVVFAISRSVPRRCVAGRVLAARRRGSGPRHGCGCGRAPTRRRRDVVKAGVSGS